MIKIFVDDFRVNFGPCSFYIISNTLCQIIPFHETKKPVRTGEVINKAAYVQLFCLKIVRLRQPP